MITLIRITSRHTYYYICMCELWKGRAIFLYLLGNRLIEEGEAYQYYKFDVAPVNIYGSMFWCLCFRVLLTVYRFAAFFFCQNVILSSALFLFMYIYSFQCNFKLRVFTMHLSKVQTHFSVLFLNTMYS